MLSWELGLTIIWRCVNETAIHMGSSLTRGPIAYGHGFVHEFRHTY
jgi:hypothetical protein